MSDSLDSSSDERTDNENESESGSSDGEEIESYTIYMRVDPAD